MKTKLKIVCGILIIAIVLIFVLFGKNLKNTYGITDQKIHLSYTTIEKINEESKLVTAKKQMDFITIMDGKEGRELAISTYEIKAGINLEKKFEDSYQIEIFSCEPIHKLEYRTDAEKNQNQDDFRNQLAPIEKAFRQKAVDYSVEYGILEQAKDRAEKIFSQLDIKAKENKIGISVPETKQTIKLPYLPLKLEIAKNSSVSRYKILEQFENMQIKVQPQSQFNRDSLILRNDIMDWEIRIGDTGMSNLNDSFANVFKNVLKTNTNNANEGKDKVQLFRYFDPLYHKGENKIEVFSYASDYYRTFFLNYNGRIYYIDAGDKLNEQTLIDVVSPIMVYLASSIRTITDEKIEYANEYKTYTTKFYEASRNLRDEFKERTTRAAILVDSLINANILKNNGALTKEEKYFTAFSNIEKMELGEKNIEIIETGTKSIDDKIALYKTLYDASDFDTIEKRKSYINKADNKEIFEDSIIGEYLRAYFIQNLLRFNIKEEEKNFYIQEMKKGSKLASRIIIAEMNDSERNEYFANIFGKRLFDSAISKDTAAKVSDMITTSSSVGDNLMFCYYDLPDFSDSKIDGKIYEQILKMNNNQQISNAFILVFNNQQFNFGIFEDNDIHALVLDDATLRFFPNIGNYNIAEKTIDVINQTTNAIYGNDVTKTIAYFFAPVISSVADGTRKDNQVAKFFYYGNWKELQIDDDNLMINGKHIGTVKLTKKSKESYRDTSDYSKKSVIAGILRDLQHSYYAESSDYYKKQLLYEIKSTVRNEMYKELFRPSPRMIIDNKIDENRRNNF